jgi:hypothetical protein
MRSTLLRVYGPFRSGQGGPISALSLVQRTPESPPPACRLTLSTDIVFRTGRLTKCKPRRPLGLGFANVRAGIPQTQGSGENMRISGIQIGGSLLIPRQSHRGERLVFARPVTAPASSPSGSSSRVDRCRWRGALSSSASSSQTAPKRATHSTGSGRSGSSQTPTG